MARSARDWVAGAIYHVFSRGSNRQAIFLNDGDYGEFEMLLSSAFRKHELDCFGWSLMPNHWHGVVRCPQGGLSRFMKDVNHRYALRFDRRWGRTAHLFANRFGAVQQATERWQQHLSLSRCLAPAAATGEWNADAAIRLHGNAGL